MLRKVEIKIYIFYEMNKIYETFAAFSQNNLFRKVKN